MPLIAERSVMLAPGACFICENTPLEGEPIFDSLKEFTPGFNSSLAGRKYVCVGCATEVAEAFGFVSNEKAAANAEAAADAAARVAAILDQVASVVGDLSPAALTAAADGHPRFVAAVEPSEADVIASVPGIQPDNDFAVPVELEVEDVEEPVEDEKPAKAKKNVPSA